MRSYTKNTLFYYFIPILQKQTQHLLNYQYANILINRSHPNRNSPLVFRLRSHIKSIVFSSIIALQKPNCYMVMCKITTK